MKQIEKPEVKVVKMEHVDICTASANVGATMSTSRGTNVDGLIFE